MGILNFRTWITFILMTQMVALKSQFLEVGTSMGASTYQGDISPFSWRGSFQGSQLAKGLLIGYSLNDIYSIKASYYSTNLSANDGNAIDEWRKTRNLSFRTKLHEFAIHLDIEPLDYFFTSHKLKPQLHFGIALFSFNPQASYKGKYRDLQPLSTEGQGLPGSGKEPYKLTQISIPIGFGLKYYISEDLSFELSFNPRKTFTDYIDDVSENYYSYDELLKYKGKMAADLAFRADEKGAGYVYPEGGSGRGNSKENDWYILNTFTVTYRFDSAWPFKASRNVKCPYR